LLFAMPASTSSPPSPSFVRLPTPAKSESDKKDYSVIKLNNGLTALLISDTSYSLEKLQVEQDAGAEASDEEDEEDDEEGSDGSDMEADQEEDEVRCL
jgi:nardilysin